LKHGISEGSILGPVLFSLYINDLPLNIQGAKLVLFVDDTNLFVTEEDESALQHKITNVMEELQIWFHKHNLTINTHTHADKNIAMSLLLSQKHFQFFKILPHLTTRHFQKETITGVMIFKIVLFTLLHGMFS
jgi:hypothetical protein